MALICPCGGPRCQHTGKNSKEQKRERRRASRRQRRHEANAQAREERQNRKLLAKRNQTKGADPLEVAIEFWWCPPTQGKIRDTISHPTRIRKRMRDESERMRLVNLRLAGKR